MYNTKFPSSFDTASARDPMLKYDGNMTYAYQKRGQVLLCEKWTTLHPTVKFMSAHPGWTATPAVSAAYSPEIIKYLEPMRNPWEGADGIIWLCVAPLSEVQSGAFYLDRIARTKHLSGPFFTEGSYTKNTPEEVDNMMLELERYSNIATRPPLLSEADCERIVSDRTALKAPLMETPKLMDLNKFMGKWYVIATIPTYFEIDMMNSVEEYSWNEAKQYIEVRFSMQASSSAKPSVLQQRATVTNKETNTRWAINPKFGIYVPLGVAYLILDFVLEEDNDSNAYSACLVGTPSRGNFWLMMRDYDVSFEENLIVKQLLEKAKRFGFDMTKVVIVKHDYSQSSLSDPHHEADSSFISDDQQHLEQGELNENAAAEN